MAIICAFTGVRSLGGIGAGASESGTGYDHWIAEFDDKAGTIGYDDINNKIHLDQGHVGNQPKIITLNMDGSVDQVRAASQLIAGDYVSDSYYNPSVIYRDHWYPAYADTGGGAVGKMQYPFTSNATFYSPQNANSNGNYTIYPYDGVAITNHGGTAENKHFVGSAQPSSGNVNDPYWFVATWNQPAVGIRRHRITYSGYSRNYPDGIAGIYYGGKIGIAAGLSSTGSGPYPASFMVISYSWDSGIVSSYTNAKVISNATSNYAYSMCLFGWKHSSNWLHTINCNLDNTHLAILYDDSADIRDQIAFDSTKATLEGAIFNFVFDGNYPNGPYIFFMKDNVTANRYYFVTWDNDNNNTSTSGGSNTGGTWNANSNAVQIDFKNGTYTSCNGKARGERAGDDFVFKADIGPSGTAVVFKMPSNLTKVQASTGSDFDITTGSAVNTRVNTFVDMSKQKSFSTVATGVTYETNATNSAQSRGTATPGTSWLNQTYIDSVTIQGITYTFGEYYYGTSGVAIGQWRNTSDSTTSNCQLYIRMDITTGQAIQQALKTIFENMSAGDTISVAQPYTQTLTLSGTGITSQLTNSNTFKNFFYDTVETTATSQYFYEATVTA
jgi:hypothetical protein